MTAYLFLGLIILACYLLGAVPFGWLIARSRGVDILRQGSGNIGATNVGRVLGSRYGALVFVLDFAKGALPVLAASWLTPFAGTDLPPDTLLVAAGTAAFIGHLFPIYLRFRGGKGVATGVGVVTVLLPVTAAVVLAAWVVVLAATRYVAVASLAAVVLLSILRMTFMPDPLSWDHAVVTVFCLFGTALVCIRHVGNIRRLAQGTEHRLKDSPTMLLISKTVHVLALGLWFGTACFFTVAALSLFQTFEAVSLKDKEARPLWFPLPEAYAQDPPSAKFPDPLRKEQGSRAAGAAVGPIFVWYYGIQAGCAFITAVTALGWWLSRKEKVHGVRAVLLLLALAGVCLGWGLERVVADLRVPRDQLTDALLQGTTTDVQPAEDARAAFVRWHGYSLLDNFAVLALVTVAMALAAQLPSDSPRILDHETKTV
jgi:acyl phosphate:glycerol-3-phosphate acyltransferase